MYFFFIIFKRVKKRKIFVFIKKITNSDPHFASSLLDIDCAVKGLMEIS